MIRGGREGEKMRGEDEGRKGRIGIKIATYMFGDGIRFMFII